MAAVAINPIRNANAMAQGANPIQPIQNKKVIQIQKGMTDHIADWLDTTKGFKDFLKAVGLYGDWVKTMFHGQLTETGQNVQTAAKDGKRLLGGIELIPKLNAVKTEVLKKDRSFTEIFFKSLDCIGSVWDGIEFFHYKKIIPLPTDTFRALHAGNSISLAVGMTRRSYLDGGKVLEHGGKLSKLRPDLENDPVRRNRMNEQVEFSRDFVVRKTCDFIKSVSYLALGIIGILSYFFAVVTAPWVAVIASTSTCVFSILGHFTDKMLKISERAPNFGEGKKA